MSGFSRFLVILCICCGSAWAQDDPPARVGRLALVENGVDFRVDRSSPVEPASINWPITSGALLDTERRGRAEVWVGSSAFRLAGNSSLEFAEVSDRQVVASLERGTLAVSVLEPDQAGDIVLETPDGRIRLRAAGRYRVDVGETSSELTVQAGRAVVDGRAGRSVVDAGQRLDLADESGVPQFDRLAGDGFDRWVADRENQTAPRSTNRYVSPQMTGYQDLSRYGDWRTEPSYGAIWYPRAIAADWAPYRYGRWVWVAPWGWTWIDQAPWGFAPFHYGRWLLLHGRWAWVPGRYVARPVYAPALVAWVGNPGWSVSFSFGTAPAVGWFPLAPREVYVPTFRTTTVYVQRINSGHFRDVHAVDRAIRTKTTAYAYRAQPQAVTVVPASRWREARPISANDLLRADRRTLERAPTARPAPDPALAAPPVRRGDQHRSLPPSDAHRAGPQPATARPERGRHEATPAAVAPTERSPARRDEPPGPSRRSADRQSAPAPVPAERSEPPPRPERNQAPPAVPPETGHGNRTSDTRPEHRDPTPPAAVPGVMQAPPARRDEPPGLSRRSADRQPAPDPVSAERSEAPPRPERNQESPAVPPETRYRDRASDTRIRHREPSSPAAPPGVMQAPPAMHGARQAGDAARGERPMRRAEPPAAPSAVRQPPPDPRSIRAIEQRAQHRPESAADSGESAGQRKPERRHDKDEPRGGR